MQMQNTNFLVYWDLKETIGIKELPPSNSNSPSTPHHPEVTVPVNNWDDKYWKRFS